MHTAGYKEEDWYKLPRDKRAMLTAFHLAKSVIESIDAYDHAELMKQEAKANAKKNRSRGKKR